MAKKTAKKAEKKINKKVTKKAVEEEAGGLSLDDAFGDEEGVEYAESKPRKGKKKDKADEEEEKEDEILENDLDEEMDHLERSVGDLSADQPEYTVKASKPISKVKKGDKIKIDGQDYTVDAHYVLIDHKTTKEMTLEIYDSQDKDYQLRYFDDQVESTMELYELKEILYVKKVFRKVEW